MLLDRETVDLVLVPSGLGIMFIYHLFLLYRILRQPETTVVGYENHNKLAWVERMLQGTTDETSLALTVISGSMSASSNLASLSITLSSLIGTWVGSTSKVFMTEVIYGDTSPSTSSVKYISLLVCFLVAFTCFIHSARYFVHANYLMSTVGSDMPVGYVQRAVIRGGNFWSMGLRALYFATVLLMWIFGPIPMFLCSAFMVIILHFLDSNSLPLHHHSFPKVATAAAKGKERTMEIGALADTPVYASASISMHPRSYVVSVICTSVLGARLLSHRSVTSSPLGYFRTARSSHHRSVISAPLGHAVPDRSFCICSVIWCSVSRRREA